MDCPYTGEINKRKRLEYPRYADVLCESVGEDSEACSPKDDNVWEERAQRRKRAVREHGYVLYAW